MDRSETHVSDEHGFERTEGRGRYEKIWIESVRQVMTKMDRFCKAGYETYGCR
jgi:hypothetical protein